jgi:DNA-binding PadR family transcriptional regulator
MTERKRDILLHPVRMRIFTEITGGQTTAKALAQTLPDIPPATLYRHLKKMVEAGFLIIVDEIPIRGTVERVYAIGTTGLSPEELSGMGVEELRGAVNMILSGFLGDFERYLGSKQGEQINPIEEGFEFSKAQLHLTDVEFARLKQDLWAVVEPMTELPPSSDRKRRTFSYLFIPLE